VATGRKLQIDNLSIWVDDGKPRFSGLSLEEAQVQVRTWIAQAEQWLELAEEMQKALKSERLTPQEQEKVDRMLKKARAKMKAKHISAEKARELFSKRVLDMRGEDFSDL
jgi:RNA-binding protein YlmH